MRPSFISREVHAARLGVKIDATREELDSAFKKMAFLFHPDRVGQDKDFAHERFVEMKESYEYLVSLLKYGYSYSPPSPPPPPSPSPSHHGWENASHQNDNDSSYDENIGFHDGCYVARLVNVELKTNKFGSLYVRWRFDLYKDHPISPGDNIYDEVDKIKTNTGLNVAYKRTFFSRINTYINFVHELEFFPQITEIPSIPAEEKQSWLFGLEDNVFPLLSGIFVVIRKSASKQWTKIDFERLIE